MSGLGLNIGLRALLASRSSLDTLGHNLANSNTPGYSRQTLGIDSGRPINLRGLGFGTGVNSSAITRSVDSLLERRIGVQTSSFSRLDSRLGVLGQVEALFGEPGELGLNTRFEDFFSSLSTLSSSPNDNVLRVGVVQSTASLTGRFNELYDSISSLGKDTLSQIQLQSQQVNVLANEVLNLNRSIAQTESSGIPANDLRDQRQEVLKGLSSYININATEDSNGAIQVTVGGQLLVGSQSVFEVQVDSLPGGEIEVSLDGDTQPLQITSGSIAGLLSIADGFFNETRAELDELAQNFILEVNRRHSVGVPGTGPFQQLTSSNPIVDGDGDGALTDELLSNSGLPFDISAGPLYFNVTDASTGEVTTKIIEIDPDRTTVQDFLDELNGAAHVNAGINSTGEIQIFAESSFGFDFSAHLQVSPNAQGTLGGSRASLGASSSEPYALTDGSTLNLTGPGGPVNVTFSSADFVAISQASAGEVVDAINADPNVASASLRAVEVDGEVFLQTLGIGTGVSLQVNGGTALGALGFTAGATTLGSDTEVGVTIGGEYTGAANGVFSFVPNMDGVIGTTPGLAIGVFNDAGQQVAVLDVGEGYQPGSELSVVDGVTAAVDFGEVSATDNDRFALNVVADSDRSDVLVALGLNSLLEGNSAATIQVREEIERDPSLISASSTGAEGDNRVLLGLLDLQSQQVSGLDDQTIGSFYGQVVGKVGFEVASTQNALEVENVLMESLVTRREQISGVNVDEELVNMIEFEQAFAAASQFIQVVNGLNDDLLRLV